MSFCEIVTQPNVIPALLSLSYRVQTPHKKFGNWKNWKGIKDETIWTLRTKNWEFQNLWQYSIQMWYLDISSDTNLQEKEIPAPPPPLSVTKNPELVKKVYNEMYL